MESHDVSRRRMLWSGETCATYLPESSVMIWDFGGLLIGLYLAMGKKSMHGLDGRASPGHTYCTA